ncbi:MAG: GAF domain-containing sensor histidine kinase [Chloroflexota bacterium]
MTNTNDSANNHKPDPKIQSTLQALELLTKQIRSGHVETDYALRLVEKVRNTVENLSENMRQQQDAGRFEALYKVSRILGTSLDLQTVLDQVMDAVIKLTGAERGFLMLRDDDGNLAVQTARNFEQKTLQSDQLEYSRTIANRVLDEGEAILTTNAAEDDRFNDNQSVLSNMLRSIMVTPLWARNRVIGIAYVENRVVAGIFSKEDLATLEALVGQASVAIDNAILFAETDEALAKKVDQLSLLRRIDLQLNQKLDANASMLYTLEMACRVSGAEEGYLGLLDGSAEDVESQHIRAVHYFNASKNQSRTTREHPILLDAAYPRAWEAIAKHATIMFDTGQYDLLTALIVPIMLEERALGVVVLMSQEGESFSSEERDLVERIVARAAVNIENGRLFKAVQDADDAKTKFVGIVAHDLKAPMTTIKGYADLLTMRYDDLTEKQHQYLHRISDTVKRMEILVSDLVDVSRINGDQFMMDPTRVRISTVVEAMRDTIMPQMHDRQHTFEEDVPETLPDLYTDYYRLMQVLTNLLTNAVKYTPDGGTITLCVQQEDDQVRFSVTDTGVGLSPEQIQQLGTPFWRAEDDYSYSQEGTGLGFFITRSLVEQMGSHIQIESTKSEGSTFSFTIGIAGDDINDAPFEPGGSS